MNLFVGGNGSGKSNLLEALGILSAAVQRGVSDADLQLKGVRLSPPALFKSAFKNRRLPVSFRIEASFEHACEYAFELMASDSDTHLKFNTERATFRNISMFGRSGNGATVLGSSLSRPPDGLRGLFDQLRSTSEFPPEFVDQLDLISKYAIYSPQTEFLRGTEIGTVSSPPIGLHGEGLAQATETLIRQRHAAPQGRQELIDAVFQLAWATGWTDQFRAGTVDPTLMSSQIKTGAMTLYFRDKYLRSNRNSITAYDASEGVLFLLFLVVMLMHKDAPKMFSLDNVDSALNPRMTKFAVSKIISVTLDDAYKSASLGPNQVFLTSHNPTAMDPFDIFDDRLRIFIVKRNEQGHTEISRLKPTPGHTREDWIKLSAGRSLSELWIANEIPGALGADI